jgi:ribosomal protein S18 acetylase RimI-like enzyme
MLRPATLRDLELVASWVRSSAECTLWAGWRVRYPIELAALAASIDFAHQGGLVLTRGTATLAFGQIVAKAGGRAHLARLIVEPASRGRGVGMLLVDGLLDRAREAGHGVASLNVDPANGTAIRLYQRLGFADAPRPADEPDPYGSRYMQRML